MTDGGQIEDIASEYFEVYDEMKRTKSDLLKLQDIVSVYLA